MKITQNEMILAEQWAERFGKAPPFSFVYDNQPSEKLLAAWPCEQKSWPLDGRRTQHTYDWRDPAGQLSVRCAVVTYADMPAVEWTLYFRNAGNTDTPILRDILAFDASWQREGRANLEANNEFILHHYRGDFCRAEIYEPLLTRLEVGQRYKIRSEGGRSCDGFFPYYNLELPATTQDASCGMLIAIGWPGQWAASFIRDQNNERGTLRHTAGQETLHVALHAGEEVRSPLMATVFWQKIDEQSEKPADEKSLMRAQNIWRRWMLQYNLPRPHGQLPKPLLLANSGAFFCEMCNADEKNQFDFITQYHQRGIPLDYWWMDAGWYLSEDPLPAWQWWKTGTWEVDSRRFPRGIGPISDLAHSYGMKTLLWFEPERVYPGSWLYREHPEWLLKDAATTPPGWDVNEKSDCIVDEWGCTHTPVLRVLNLGNPQAREWITDRVSGILKENRIDLFRQDFNFPPLNFWCFTDTPERQGMTENLYVQGYLKFWDDLRLRHPNMLIDSCASGGRRNDLESMRRSVPLHPTDYNYSDHAVKQAFHHTLFKWLPFFGSPVQPISPIDAYAFHSGIGPATTLGFDVRDDKQNWPLLGQLIAQRELVAADCYGDYYPLMPYSRSEYHWMAWQFNVAESGRGFVQAFRRALSPQTASVLKLCELDADAVYIVTDLDSPGRAAERTGRSLMEDGIEITLPLAASAKIVRYVKKDG